MNKTILISILFSLTTFINAYGQNKCNYEIFSENQEFVLKTKPFSFQPHDTIGRTEVIRVKDSILLYNLNRYFDLKYLFLSNNGLSIFELNQAEVIKFYNSGKLINQLNISDLINLDNETCQNNIFYELTFQKERSTDKKKFEIEYYANKNNFFIHNDTVYLLTCDDSILLFNIKSGKYINKNYIYTIPIHILKNSKERKIIKESFNPPNWSNLPNDVSGEKFEYVLAEHLGMIYEEPQNENFKYYNLTLKCLINSKGICEESYPDFEIKSKEDSIVKFIKSVQFDTTIFPREMEKWIFLDFFIPLRKVDKNIAKLELQEENRRRTEEYKIRIVSDSINVIYIPKDLKDCIKQLDKELNDTRKRQFIQNGVSIEHMQLGLWIRNNWGLWGGSRLQTYFMKLGFNHPDDMSGFILDIYFKYLKDNSLDINKELERYLKNK